MTRGANIIYLEGTTWLHPSNILPLQSVVLAYLKRNVDCDTGLVTISRYPAYSIVAQAFQA